MIKWINLIYAMHTIGLLSPAALFRLASAIRGSGVNLMALLGFAAGMYGDRTALIDERETYTYRRLYNQAAALAQELRERYRIGKGSQVGVLCRNHASLVKTIFAVSAAGADLIFLNTEMSGKQLNRMLAELDPDLLVYDEEYEAKLVQSTFLRARLLSYHETLPAVDHIAETGGAADLQFLYRAASGTLVLLTGGTTGQPKKAAHQPSLFDYLDPFVDFVKRLQIKKTHTTYIATPIYHGYGIAVLLLLFATGKKAVIQRGFHAAEACRLVREHQVEAMTVVPLMLHKMLRTSAADLKTLTCIASGGAELSPRLVTETLSSLGKVLFNLYGTSEAGLNLIATPDDLLHDPRTVGKPIRGVKVLILDDNDEPVDTGKIGRICIRNRWSMRNREGRWINTGDLGYVDEQGYYYLCGRADSMIVSGGENVYPLEVEQILLTHPLVEDAAVSGVMDELFGQRLKAVVVRTRGSGADLTQEELRVWLQTRLARYQMPREIVFVEELPYTPLGKLDRRSLQAEMLGGSPG